MIASTSTILQVCARIRFPFFGIIAGAAMLCGAAAAPDTAIAPPADATPRATVTIDKIRHGDILWENDLTAQRIYGRLLEPIQPPSSSGIDVWGKSVPWPFMVAQLRTGDQHNNHGEGLDFYNVGTFRGAGGLGIWRDNKLWVSRNYNSVRLLQNGPDTARFEVTYAPWPVGIDQNVWETRRFELPLGTHFTRMTSTIGSNRKKTFLVGIGISKNPTSARSAVYTVDRARGRIAWWGPDEPTNGSMGVALMVDPAMIADVRDDANDHLILLRVKPGKPFVYYTGSAWSKGSDIADATAWQAYIDSQKPNFTPVR